MNDEVDKREEDEELNIAEVLFRVINKKKLIAKMVPNVSRRDILEGTERSLSRLMKELCEAIESVVLIRAVNNALIEKENN